MAYQVRYVVPSYIQIWVIINEIAGGWRVVTIDGDIETLCDLTIPPKPTPVFTLIPYSTEDVSK